MSHDPREVLTRPAPEPDRTVRFGPGDHELYEVYLPAAGAGSGTWVVLVHGGFWRSGYTRTHLRPLATALSAEGHPVALLEYRGTGAEGGGWPQTFQDVQAGLAALHASEDVAGLVLVGHSAGGHLATLLLHHAPTGVAGVVSLAGCMDLALTAELGLGDGAVQDLLGGTPAQRPEVYAEADPCALGAPPAPVLLVHGLDDDRVPPSVSRSWMERVGRAGTDDLVEAPDCEHFGLIDPQHPVFTTVLDRLHSLTGPTR